MPPINPAHQLVILMRLGEFCQYRGGHHEQNPWEFMRRKLADTEEPLLNLKTELFAATKRKLLEELKGKQMDEERHADYKVLLERLLAAGDFADVAIHLTTQGPAPPLQLQLVSQILDQVKPYILFMEERKPAESRSPSAEKLIHELSKRLDLELMGTILKRKPRTAKRKSFVLRRIRKNVADYCAVLRIPTDLGQTFTPFMLPRIEALIVANLRFLNRFR